MTTPESLTQVARISDAERDRAIRLLREHSVLGRLSPDTFIRRIELALTAQRRAELDELTADLPDQGRLTRLSLRAVAAVSGFGLRLRGAWQTPRLQPLVLPGPETPVLRIGRLPGSELRLTHESVSRTHAELRRVGEDWTLRDLASTNGTLVNGCRIIGQVVVRPGDRVAFGHTVFRIQGRSDDAAS
jgi:hypothetical protein